MEQITILKAHCSTNHTLTFDTDEYPKLPKQKQSKRNQNGNQKLPEQALVPQTATNNSTNAKALCDQIIADIKADLTKIISTKVNEIQNELMTTITKLNTKLKTDFDTQIVEVIMTMHALNQHFTKVMEHFPTTPTTMPAHKKSKRLGVAN